MYLRILLLCCLVTVSSPARLSGDEEITRQWTDKQGNQIRATFIESRNGEVQLRDEKGNVGKFKLIDFAEPDMKYLRDLGAYQRKIEAGEKLEPPVDPAAQSLKVLPLRIRPSAGAKSEPVPDTALGDFTLRTWTDSQGRKLQAKFLSAGGAEVVIDKSGKVFRIPLSNLSIEDKKYVALVLKALQRDDLLAELRESSVNSQEQVAAAKLPVTFNMPQPSVNPPPLPGITPPLTNSAQAHADAHAERLRQIEQQSKQLAAEAAERAAEQQRIYAERQAQLAAMRQAEAERRQQEENDRAQRRIAANQHTAPLPSGPSYNSTSVGGTQCSNCNKITPGLLKAGDRCSHCGVVFEAITKDGKVVDQTSSGTSIRRINVKGIITLVLLLLGGIGWVGRKFFGT